MGADHKVHSHIFQLNVAINYFDKAAILLFTFSLLGLNLV